MNALRALVFFFLAASTAAAAPPVLKQTFNNPGTSPGANTFQGISSAMDGNRVVVGAELDSTGAAQSGTAHVYDATTGALLYTLLNPTPGGGDNFGISVAISGHLVAVGALNDSTAAL